VPVLTWEVQILQDLVFSAANFLDSVSFGVEKTKREALLNLECFITFLMKGKFVVVLSSERNRFTNLFHFIRLTFIKLKVAFDI
jgi:hypothetical protein